jgi:hypothetical protein
MGKAIKSIGSIFKPGKYTPSVADRSLFDVSKEAGAAGSEYEKLLGRSRASSEAGAAAPEVIKQMGEAALGRGPSLAEVQLKSAQDRNLAQQLGAIQGSRAGSSALGQRALVQSMGASGQDLAQQAAMARLGERAQFLGAAGAADSGLRSDIQGKLGVDVMPKQSLQQWEQQRVGAVNAAAQQKAAGKTALAGALMGGVGSVLGGMATGGTGFFGKAASAAVPDSGGDFGGGAAGGSTGYANTMQQHKTGGLVTRNYKDGGFVAALEKAAQELGNKIKDSSGRKQEDVSKQTFLNTKSSSKPSYQQGGKVEKEKTWDQVLEEAAQALGNKIKDSSGKQYTDVDSQTLLNVPKKEKVPKKAMGGTIQDHRGGGDVDGPGTETSDSIPAMLSDGEFVIRAREVKKPGILAHLEAINSGKITKKHLKSLAEALQEKKGK